MSRQEFHTALQHLTDNPQHIVFFEDDLKQYVLSMDQDQFHTNYWDVYTNYWEVVKFISACYEIAEAHGLFASTGCLYDQVRKERAQ